MTEADRAFTPATRLARLIRRGALSPLEVVQTLLARIERVNPRLNAYCTVAAEQALEAAKKATTAVGRRSARLGPLHGVPVSIKDLTPTRGIRTTWGSKIYEHHVPDEDALVVARLKAAGAIVIGKTNTPEFGAGANTFSAVFGVTRNPWNPALTPGGVDGRRRGRARHRSRPARSGHGSRRLAAPAGVVLRRRRIPDVARPRPRASGTTGVGPVERDGADGAHGRRHGVDAVGDGGRRCARGSPMP